jgi:hypothetical protein
MIRQVCVTVAQAWATVGQACGMAGQVLADGHQLCGMMLQVWGATEQDEGETKELPALLRGCAVARLRGCAVARNKSMPLF